MANSPQARKRARQNEKHRVLNASQRSAMRTSIKRFLKAIQSGDLDTAALAYRQATSRIDRAARDGHHHRNRAARLKSRLNARLKAARSASA